MLFTTAPPSAACVCVGFLFPPAHPHPPFVFLLVVAFLWSASPGAVGFFAGSSTARGFWVHAFSGLLSCARCASLVCFLAPVSRLPAPTGLLEYVCSFVHRTFVLLLCVRFLHSLFLSICSLVHRTFRLLLCFRFLHSLACLEVAPELLRGFSAPPGKCRVLLRGPRAACVTSKTSMFACRKTS